ncbi:MAG: Na/Pi symporter [Candidatus Aureabacteria bacterium]|nr:Na/Pi symporter [Candidatus Auribacterota bacterium]
MDRIVRKPFRAESSAHNFIKAVIAVFLVYLFLVSIKMMGVSFKMFGKNFAEMLINSTTNRFVGLFIGILATSIIQSSSTVTSIVVGLVGGGMLTVTNAVPIVMGANIGTSVTNTLVSLGHITRKEEFERAFHGAILHDHFNVLTVIVLFPLEMATGFLQKSASFCAKYVTGIKFISGEGLFSRVIGAPVDILKEYVTSGLCVSDVAAGVIMISVSFVMLFISLSLVVKVMRAMMLSKVEVFFDRYIFRHGMLSLLFGLLLTAFVQSSSVTTSLVVPILGAGILTPAQVFPYMMGANIGTTVTAMLAALATASQPAIVVAFVHLLFNAFGVAIWYPLKEVPLKISDWISSYCITKRRNAIIYVLLVFFILPALLIFLSRLF